MRNKQSAGLWMRIGVAALLTLMAVPAITGPAAASVQDLTITSLTKISLTQVRVSGTATFSDGDQYAEVYGTLAQAGVRSRYIDDESTQFGCYYCGDPVSGDPLPWSLVFTNPYGWKSGPATLSITAESERWDDYSQQWIYFRQSKSLKVNLPSKITAN
jgi:hypothetical protein